MLAPRLQDILHPFGQVPVIKVAGGGYIGQRKAILRWAGRLAAAHNTGGMVWVGAKIRSRDFNLGLLNPRRTESC